MAPLVCRKFSTSVTCGNPFMKLSASLPTSLHHSPGFLLVRASRSELQIYPFRCFELAARTLPQPKSTPIPPPNQHPAQRSRRSDHRKQHGQDAPGKVGLFSNDLIAPIATNSDASKGYQDTAKAIVDSEFTASLLIHVLVIQCLVPHSTGSRVSLGSCHPPRYRLYQWHYLFLRL